MKETCTQFGPGGRLAGIFTEPAGHAVGSGCILVSAGLLPKAGPYRLYTELARRLAEDGVITLRFDLDGIGDSAPAASGRPLRERTELELGFALEHVKDCFTLDELTLGGLCSGAEDSLRGAAASRDVTGVVMIDPFAYRVPGWYSRHALHRAARRTLRALGIYEPLAPAARSDVPPAPRAVEYRYMERDESARILGELLARDTRVHFFYTAGVREAFNHPQQLRAAFPELDFRDRVTLDYFPHMDHTQLLADDRRELVEAVARRITGKSAVLGRS
jgi:hypothetical protein